MRRPRNRKQNGGSWTDTIFKKAFRDPEVFSGFARDVLGIPVDIAVVHQEFSYPTAVGHMKVAYDLFGEDPERRVIVELQHIREPDFFDRFLHDHLVSIVEQAQSHEQYRIERDVLLHPGGAHHRAP